jgi:hypothetical protein
VDELLRRFRRGSWLNVVHFVETRKRWILACLLALVLMVWIVGRWGVPFAAKVIAGHLPKKVSQMAGQRTLNALDRSLLQPSQLDAADMKRLKAHFRPIIEKYRDYDIRVLFRVSKGLGANAFALPDGTVIFTDDMVKLSADDFALTYLKGEGISPARFADLMRRVEKKRAAISSSSDNSGHGRTSKPRWGDYLSTHPSMKERLRRFEQ